MQFKRMYYIWLILAVFCFVYYMMCATYVGPGAPFVFVWLIGTLFFVAVFVVRLLEVKYGLVIAGSLRKAFIIMMSVGMLVFISVECLIISGMNSKSEEECRYMIVLGCQVRGNELSKLLLRRLETACNYAKEHKGTKIIVSGGQGEGENLSEAQAMYNYLVENGVESERIFMEDKSTNTDENIRFSLQYIDDKDAQVGIVTNDFHVFRAVKLAKAKGLNNACGIASPSDTILILNFMVRESVGIVKDFAVGNFFR